MYTVLHSLWGYSSWQKTEIEDRAEEEKDEKKTWAKENEKEERVKTNSL